MHLLVQKTIVLLQCYVVCNYAVIKRLVFLFTRLNFIIALYVMRPMFVVEVLWLSQSHRLGEHHLERGTRCSDILLQSTERYMHRKPHRA